jgi:multimeric flavodoxin WrbA
VRALAINCTLKAGSAPSSTELLLEQFRRELARHDVPTETVRAVDHAIRPGVTADEGVGDAWPHIRERILDADILVIGSPIWLGNPSSVCHRVLERMDAFLGETDDRGRMVTVDRVALAAVVGNEDGAHNVGARLFQGLNDLGFTVPANGMAYWVGEAMQGVDLRDLDRIPDVVLETVRVAVDSAVHLAHRLAADPYPAAA